MNEPKVTIKNLKSFRGMEGYGFNADIYINGVKSMFVMDSANGGQFDYEIVFGQGANLQLIKDYVKSISKRGDDSDIELDMYIAKKVDEHETLKLKAKNEKKMAKLMAEAIVFGVPDANGYRFFNFKRPLSSIPAIILQSHVDKAKKVMKEGEVFLNKNLTELGVKI